VRVASPRGAFRLNATVQAAGDASQFSRYQVGFLQTVMADETMGIVNFQQVNESGTTQ
jgi:hypothetical protein